MICCPATFKQSIKTGSQSSISCKDWPLILQMQSPERLGNRRMAYFSKRIITWVLCVKSKWTCQTIILPQPLNVRHQYFLYRLLANKISIFLFGCSPENRSKHDPPIWQDRSFCFCPLNFQINFQAPPIFTIAKRPFQQNKKNKLNLISRSSQVLKFEDIYSSISLYYTILNHPNHVFLSTSLEFYHQTVILHTNKSRLNLSSTFNGAFSHGFS